MIKVNQTPDDLLPLSPANFHILLALADGDRHGYCIMLLELEISRMELFVFGSDSSK